MPARCRACQPARSVVGVPRQKRMSTERSAAVAVQRSTEIREDKSPAQRMRIQASQKSHKRLRYEAWLLRPFSCHTAARSTREKVRRYNLHQAGGVAPENAANEHAALFSEAIECRAPPARNSRQRRPPMLILEGSAPRTVRHRHRAGEGRRQRSKRAESRQAYAETARVLPSCSSRTCSVYRATAIVKGRVREAACRRARPAVA